MFLRYPGGQTDRQTQTGSNMMGHHCEECKPFFYHDPDRPVTDPHVCRGTDYYFASAADCSRCRFQPYDCAIIHFVE